MFPTDQPTVVDLGEERLRRQPSGEASPLATAELEILNILDAFTPRDQGQIFARVFAGVSQPARDAAVDVLRSLAETILARANER